MPVRFPIAVPARPAIDPCPQLEERGGIWRFKADVVGQKYSKEARFASGMRQPVAVAWHDGHLYTAMNSRDSLDTLFPEKGYTAEDNADRADRADAAGRAGGRVRLAVLLLRQPRPMR